MKTQPPRKAMWVLGLATLAWSACGGSAAPTADEREASIPGATDHDARGSDDIETTASRLEAPKKTMKYLGNSASNDDRQGWFTATQGLANGDPAVGDNYWYLSKKIENNRNTYIYRVNYNQHLGHNFSYDKRKIRLPGGSAVCEHVGDIDYYVHKGVGYIVAGYEECGDSKGRLAFFRASDIDGTSDTLPPRSVLMVDALQGKNAPWAAVRNDGRVYSSYGGSSTNLSKIYEYRISWDDVAAGVDYLTATSSRTITMRDQDGDAISVVHKQGADFSTDGTRFYIVNGHWDKASAHYIRVFDTTQSDTSWYLVDQSSHSSMPFKYQSNDNKQEPEGLSFFDVNNISDYHPDMLRGELFVILMEFYDAANDHLWLKHYTRICDNGSDYLGIGSADYCVDCGPCGSNEGDCDSDSQCEGNRVCVRDIGSDYGWASTTDVCKLPPGDGDYCLEHGPCGWGEGDCDYDDDCAGRLTCNKNVGAIFFWPETVDVCL